MTHPLDGPRLKVRRAKVKINGLRLTQDAFAKDANYKLIRAEFNPKTGKYAYRVLIDILPSLDWGICIGEIAYNLRSALDGLVWQLALKNPRIDTPAWDTQFPIFLFGRPNGCLRSHKGRTRCKAKGSHFNCRGLDMLQSLLPGHKAGIERFQPYKRGGGGKSALLHVLQEINNADKHRLLQVAGLKPAMLSYAAWGEEDAADDFVSTGPDILVDGAVVAEARPHVNVYPKLIPLIAFGDGCSIVQGKAAPFTLSNIADHVSEIIESFAPEFS